MSNWGLSFSGFAQDLWSEELINTEDPSKYINEFKGNVDFASRFRNIKEHKG